MNRFGRPTDFRMILWLACLVVAAPAGACTLCSCTASTSALSFGSYSPVTASPKDATTQVQVDCTGAVALLGTVQVQASAGGSGNALQRRMTFVGNSLAYNIYADSARTQILGSGTGGTTTINTPLNGSLFFSTSAAVYGRVPAGQWVASGTYTDTIVITVQY